MPHLFGNTSTTKAWPVTLFPMSDSANYAGSQTAYFSYNSAFTAEASGQIKLPSGTITKIVMNVTANSLNSSSTITLRKNAVATAITGTIAAGATGQIEFTGSVAIADGDLISLEGVLGGVGGNTFSLRNAVLYLEP